MALITPIPAFKDNYLWLLQNAGENWLVDPGDAEAVRRELDRQRLELHGILITHHHPDHIGGVEALRRPGMRIIGPALDVLPWTTEPLAGGETLHLAGLTFEVLAVPGHTLNHLAFVCRDTEPPVLFCGDTLFSAGCGRLFEGTAEQMHASLTLLKRLPDSTRVYCAHEYTQANTRFALTVDSENPDLLSFARQVDQARQQNRPTLPSTIGLEKRVNPFLRTLDPGVQNSVASPSELPLDEVVCFARLRKNKDNF